MKELTLLPSGSWLEDEFGSRSRGLIVWKDEQGLRVFGTPTTAMAELWDGPSEGQSLAKELGASFHDVAEFDASFLREWARHDRITFPWVESEFAARLMRLMSSHKKFTQKLHALADWRVVRGTSRAVKSPEELAAFRQSVSLSAREHRHLMEGSWIGRAELELAHEFRARHLLSGVDELAYDSIVAGGERGCILHARASSRILQDGELVLIDAGGKGQGWCADITRTWPTAACFSVNQREVYEVVLAAQKSAIAFVMPGRTLEEIHEHTVHELQEGMRRKGWRDEADRIAELYPHRTGHWLGRRVHDHCPSHDEEGRAVKLLPGMVLTVEPGLYFRSGPRSGIGIRIEDDVVVTETGCEVMSHEAPKEIEEIENIRARATVSR